MMITSTSNDKIKYMEKLRKSASFRHEEGLFPVEGIRMIREVPDERLETLFYTEKAYLRYKDEISALSQKAVEVSEACMNRMSDTETPQGIIAAVSMKTSGLRDIIDEADPLILILEKLQDPGNMGTIIRTAEAAGVTGIIVSSDSSDIYNPKVIRSTMGAILRVRIYVSDDLVEDIRLIREKGVKVYAMHLQGDEFYAKDFTKGTAFLIGNEGNGLSEAVSNEADELMRIPMMGSVESLNAAVSASVVSYEALRQRRSI